MTINQNLAKGLCLLAIAAYFGIQAFGLPIGSFNRAGPGLFPLIVSGALFLLGAAIVARTWLTPAQALAFDWRNIGLVTAGLICFTLLSQYVNMLLAIAVLVPMASYASDDFSVSRVIKTVVVLAVFALALRVGLGFQLPLY